MAPICHLLQFLDEYARLQLWWFVGTVVLFHSSEFVLAFAFHGRQVTLGSLLITREYLVALVCALIEHVLEGFFFPRLKHFAWVSYLGLALVVTGEVIRKAAIVTAQSNFTHDIKQHRRHDHELVTSGIYRFVRHPGYLGFFLWSIATQVMLVNPVCVVAYTAVTWRFFADRIPYPFQASIITQGDVCNVDCHVCDHSKCILDKNVRYEEWLLRRFFGLSYVEYARKVPSGIPWVD